MSPRRRASRAATAATAAALVASLVGTGIALDRYRLERRREAERWRIERGQLEARLGYYQAVAACAEAGGRWWRGDCLDPEPPRS